MWGRKCGDSGGGVMGGRGKGRGREGLWCRRIGESDLERKGWESEVCRRKS